MQQAKDKGCGSKISRGCSQLPGAPLYQLSALDSLRTPRHDLTCMGVLPRKHRPVGQSYSSPLAVTQKGQMSRMTKALQQLCMTPTAPSSTVAHLYCPFHTSTGISAPPVTIAALWYMTTVLTPSPQCYNTPLGPPERCGSLPQHFAATSHQFGTSFSPVQTELATPRNAPMLP